MLLLLLVFKRNKITKVGCGRKDHPFGGIIREKGRRERDGGAEGERDKIHNMKGCTCNKGSHIYSTVESTELDYSVIP